ncbi:MAG TPA: nicotinate-nucleotide adenylyltransferase [Bacillota bacterium]|nr:nicotinate-nucleotide adenylyltransferase [Bacillota bacterium]
MQQSLDPCRLGIMGGTFDPIHLGHLVAAEAAREQFDLEQVLFVPARLPPHKQDREITPAEQRHAMVLLATANHPRFVASRVELDRPGPSYTVDTLRFFRATHPRARLYFITGADALMELDTWKDPEELLRLCHMIVVSRPGCDRERLREKAADLQRRMSCHIEELAAPALAISSRDLRQRVAEGKSLRYLVPREVRDYILKHRLYRREAATP